VALRLQTSSLEEAKRVAESEGVALNPLINVAVATIASENPNLGRASAPGNVPLRARNTNLSRASVVNVSDKESEGAVVFAFQKPLSMKNSRGGSELMSAVRPHETPRTALSGAAFPAAADREPS
jgi:hypothetical protein